MAKQIIQMYCRDKNEEKLIKEIAKSYGLGLSSFLRFAAYSKIQKNQLNENENENAITEKSNL